MVASIWYLALTSVLSVGAVLPGTPLRPRHVAAAGKPLPKLAGSRSEDG